MIPQLARLLLLVFVALAGCSRQEPVTIRVMTYNIHHAEGMDGVTDIGRIADVIRRQQPDLVSMQEVDRGVARTGRMDQPALLAELTGMEVVFEKNIAHQGGDYGNAILSRFPIVSSCNHFLPQLRPGEQRGLLEVRVDVAGEDITFLATHFDYRPDDTERMASVAMLEEWLRAWPRQAVILAGDLNDLPASRVHTAITELLRDAWHPSPEGGLTYPADEPLRRIDYVLFSSGAGLTCVEQQVIVEPVASDHRPLLATFTWQPR